ncbi:MAG: methylmalonyl-CoA mutase [Candidatus Lokiarchaeota archaeon]|nr:methylmalonyl-CoA mutase [Candidatus Lokiarchaeota archaeon]
MKVVKEQKEEKEPEKRIFKTLSDWDVKEVYTADDVEVDKSERPGKFPFTRGIHKNMYRGRLWTFRQFAGFGTAEDTNARFKFLLAHGETGLSTAFDYPTLYGVDSDEKMAHGEVGKCGVAVSSLKDMEILFDGIPLDQVSTSMTINGPAIIVWAFYIAAAENQGVPQNKLRGTIQNDILKEYIAQKSWIFPPEPSVKLIVDTIEYGTKYIPKWNTVSISGYHIREAGSTAVQELAFTLADGLTYVDRSLARGLNIDDFAPRLSFFFNAHNNFFEEIAKYRAARRIWAKEMKKRGAKNPRSQWMRFHTQTAGVSLTAQQPKNNIIRVAIQALAAVLGGTQSLHTNSYDEALALPSEEAVRIALRTQQIIAKETGVADTVDPLGGSYYIEWLTDKMEKETYEIFDKIESKGGVIEAIKKGWFQKEIAAASYKFQKRLEKGERKMVGVNCLTEANEDSINIPILEINEEVEKKQIERLAKLRKTRNNEKVDKYLKVLKDKAENTKENLMPYILDCVRAYATLGEIRRVLVDVYTEYEQIEIF